MKCHGWSVTILRMVTHHAKDGHQPSKIYQKEEYYRLEIWHPDLGWYYQIRPLIKPGWTFLTQGPLKLALHCSFQSPFRGP